MLTSFLDVLFRGPAKCAKVFVTTFMKLAWQPFDLTILFLSPGSPSSWWPPAAPSVFCLAFCNLKPSLQSFCITHPPPSPDIPPSHMIKSRIVLLVSDSSYTHRSPLPLVLFYVDCCVLLCPSFTNLSIIVSPLFVPVVLQKPIFTIANPEAETISLILKLAHLVSIKY